MSGGSLQAIFFEKIIFLRIDTPPLLYARLRLSSPSLIAEHIKSYYKQKKSPLWTF